jgi:hypothetical protein
LEADRQGSGERRRRYASGDAILVTSAPPRFKTGVKTSQRQRDGDRLLDEMDSYRHRADLSFFEKSDRRRCVDVPARVPVALGLIQTLDADRQGSGDPWRRYASGDAILVTSAPPRFKTSCRVWSAAVDGSPIKIESLTDQQWKSPLPEANLARLVAGGPRIAASVRARPS